MIYDKIYDFCKVRNHGNVYRNTDKPTPRVDFILQLLKSEDITYVINAIALKKMMPELNIVLLDGEEVGGLGSQRVSDQINSGFFGKIDWVLNLELQRW